MNLDEIIHELKSLGTEQNRKIYSQCGAGPNLYGVSLTNIKILAKKIKQNHLLAMTLWKTKNIDAQILATYIIDPQEINPEEMDEWLHEITYYILIDEFVQNIVINSTFAHQKAITWIHSKHEYIARAGWNIIIYEAIHDETLNDGYFLDYLEQIAENIHQAPNRTKEAMNNTLIAIGLRNTVLQEIALQYADKIGEVEIEHSNSSCKIPFARDYILKSAKQNQIKTKKL